MKNTQNPPFLHVKRENTRKTGTKMVENTLFSQIDKILKIYPRLDEYISFPFVPGSRTGFKRLCGHILVSSKGDQTYYTSDSSLINFKLLELGNEDTTSTQKIWYFLKKHI